ncbi:hypothetical protein E2C01_066102 [Portunus trituberculatus]|uniref:Uncharacterized protein n=1 Tax=Portunus trituberculatus TaxID=210409 RepID=A0A5B7HKL6_PORTR|nr:hypothetical protein [Portunus trituberculatus]
MVRLLEMSHQPGGDKQTENLVWLEATQKMRTMKDFAALTRVNVHDSCTYKNIYPVINEEILQG